MKKVFGVVMLGLVLSGCTLFGGSSAPVSTGSEDINVSLTGTLTVGKDETYILQQSGKSTQLHDGAATLAPYVGKSITVTGQYSGTTLYVDSVK